MGINKWALEKWIEALRSGEYKQGHDALCNVDPRTGERYYCCLGVVAETLNLGEWTPAVMVEKEYLRAPLSSDGIYFSLYGSLEERIWDVIGLPLDQNILIDWNDNDKLTFNEIADRLEEYLDE